MAFTEFCCKAGGSNLNSGTRTGSSTEPGTSADFTYASGSWVAATGVFTVSSGNPQTDGVAVGDFASVYANGSSVTGFVGRVTAVSSATITVSLTAKAGTAPTDGVLTRTLKIGGAWQGPNGTSWFPWALGTLASLTNASGNVPRINVRGGTDYSLTGAGSFNSAGPYKVQGYTTLYGDGGRAVFNGGTSGSSYTVVTVTADKTIWDSLEFTGNGGTGSGISFWNNSSTAKWCNCVWHTMRGHPYFANGELLACELYGNNAGGGTTAAGGLRIDGGKMRFCVVHDNTNDGINIYSGVVDIQSVKSYRNTRHGMLLSESGAAVVSHIHSCDFYDNGSDGVRIANSSNGLLFDCDNSNFVMNGGYGVNGSGSGSRIGLLRNCGFGSGTKANASGQTTGLSSIEETGSLTYITDTTPWIDPDNGDFSLSPGSEAIDAGSQILPAADPTTGYEDIGSAGALHSGGGSASPYFGSGGRGFRPVKA